MRLLEGRLDGDPDAFVDRMGAVGDAHDCAVQAFDARYVAGRDHLRSAVEHANRAVERGENVARDRAVEILLYAAGRRQINRAVEMGITTDAPVLAVVDGADEAGAAAALTEALTAVEEGAALSATDEATVRAFFDIGDAERCAAAGDLEDLVQERVALLDVEK
jgi:KEOPS complex subunit Cgi121